MTEMNELTADQKLRVSAMNIAVSFYANICVDEDEIDLISLADDIHTFLTKGEKNELQ